MGKSTGFMEWSRRELRERPPAERLEDWADFKLPILEEETRQQAGRCMDCGVPFCQQGCPLGNLIPDWNDAIYRGDWRRAFLALEATNPLPEFTGRLCPAPCEGSCVLGINDDAVSIEQMELATSDRAFAEGWVQPRAPREESDRRVAVVGSGPAGLAAATLLRESGHGVTIFERDELLGGLLRYGIPDFKLEKWIIDRRLALLEEAGVTFKVGVEVGSAELSWPELMSGFDAVVLCTGAPKPRDLDVPGRALSGVHFAMELLSAQSRATSGEAPLPPQLSAAGKRVVIIGGGDTGSDCLGTVLRHGAQEVTQLELMPAPPQERAEGNPWPTWPLIYRVSSSQAEGGERRFSFMTERFEGVDGVLTALVGREVKVSLEGRRSRLEPVGEPITIPCEMALLAMGFTGPDLTSLALPVDERGYLVVDESGRSPSAPLYVAGDAKRGASLIVWALSDGVEVARAVDQALRGSSPILSRGADAPFLA